MKTKKEIDVNEPLDRFYLWIAYGVANKYFARLERLSKQRRPGRPPKNPQ